MMTPLRHSYTVAAETIFKETFKDLTLSMSMLYPHNNRRQFSFYTIARKIKVID